MSDYERFQIHSPRDIAGLLRDMQKKRDRLLLRFTGSTETIITRVLDVDEKAGRVFLDGVLSPLQSHIALSCRAISFEAVVGRTRIAFRVNRIRRAQHDGRAALVMDLPESLLRYQRRASVRVPVETAFIDVPLGAAKPDSFAKGIVRDIGAGGITLIDEARIIDYGINASYSGCTLFLPQMESLAVNIRFRHMMEIAGKTHLPMHRIGCQFFDLSDAVTAKIRRFVTETDRMIRLSATDRDEAV